MIKRVLLYFALLLWFVVPVTAQPTIFIEDQTIDPVTNISIEVQVTGFIDILSLQFSVNWDPAFLQFENVSPGGVESDPLPDYNLSNFGTTMSDTGKLTTSWFSQSLQGITLPDSATLFTINFQVLGESGDSTETAITSMPLMIEFYNENGDELNVSVAPGTLTILSPNSTEEVPAQLNKLFTSYQNEPNPFKDETVIKFDVHQAADFFFEIYDTKGNLIYTKKYFYAKGKQSIILNSKILPSSGIYFYKLKTSDYFITNRMILVR